MRITPQLLLKFNSKMVSQTELKLYFIDNDNKETAILRHTNFQSMLQSDYVPNHSILGNEHSNNSQVHEY